MYGRLLAIAFMLGMLCLLSGPAAGQEADRAPQLWTALPDDLAPLLDEGLTDDETRHIADRFLANRAAVLAHRHDFPEGLMEVFDAEPELRNVFVSALDDHRDQITNAAQIMDDLRSLDENRFKEYIHLATALAVVHDTPAHMGQEMDRLTYGVTHDQFPASVGPAELYEYYTNPPNGVRFRFQPKDLPWAMLVYVVDNQASASDRQWASRRFRGAAVSAMYTSVRYDHGKLDRETPKLGDRPYSLPNLLMYGGVCGDQTYFASRVAKSLCVPALGATGESRFGGRHAWVGYLTTVRRKAMLVFSGRFLTDYYYTGRVSDPQTGLQVLERHVAMMFDGMSVSYPSYERSRALIQLAQQAKVTQPAQSLALVQRALTVNPFSPDGWRLLMEHFTAGRAEPEEALKWFNRMLDVLRPHPDMTFECLGAFINCYAGDDLDRRTQMYRRALAIYSERPDLQMALCTKLADEMIAAGKKREALMFLLRPILSSANEGSVVLPAVAMAVELAIELDVAEQAHAELTKALQQFPRRRRGSDENSPAYEEFESLLSQLDGA